MDGILIIDKPLGITSFDVVSKVRKIYHTKKVGHCGTLDPDASGVLVLCLNKATKVLQFLQAQEKEYVATLSLGVSTDSYDASGKVVETKPFTGVSTELVKEVLTSFLGTSLQTPPIYSAIKVNGKKLYDYARNGQEVEIAPREITIESIELLDHQDHLITFRVKCSKGTYIRSLCVDIAKKLDYPGHMCALRRTQSGVFTIDKAHTLEELEKAPVTLMGIEEALSSYPSLVLEDDTIVYHGKKIKSDIQENILVKNKEGKALAIYGPDGNGYLKSVRGLW